MNIVNSFIVVMDPPEISVGDIFIYLLVIHSLILKNVFYPLARDRAAALDSCELLWSDSSTLPRYLADSPAVSISITDLKILARLYLVDWKLDKLG